MGPILPKSAFDYSGMKTIGEVRIHQFDGHVSIVMSGFEFDEAMTCRERGAKITAWLADLLAAQVAAERVAPAGEIRSCLG